MAQEERKCGSGSCGGGAGGGGGGRGGGAWSASRSSKKQKQKKPPQRGLGVAQLERLRLEEQQKIYAVSLYPSPPFMNSFGPSASLPNFLVESEFNPSSAFFGNISPVPNMDVAALGPVPSWNVRNYSNYDAEMTSRVMDHELELGLKMNLPLESNLAMGGPGLMQRVGSDHPPLLANASSVSLQSYQLEPPSNQSHHHGSVAQFRPQGDVVPGGGVKRSYPFSLENPPALFFPCKIHKVGNPITNRPVEPSFSGIDNLREGPSRSSSIMESSSTDSMKENKVSGGEHLTLAPPSVDPPPRGQHFAFGVSRSYSPNPGFEFPQYRGYPEGFVYGHGPGWTDQLPQQQQFQPPCYNFLPPTAPPNNVEDTHTDGESKGTSKGVDLNLKL